MKEMKFQLKLDKKPSCVVEILVLQISELVCYEEGLLPLTKLAVTLSSCLSHVETWDWIYTYEGACWSFFSASFFSCCEPIMYTRCVMKWCSLVLQRSEFPQWFSTLYRQTGSVPSRKLTFGSPGSTEQCYCKIAFGAKGNGKGTSKLAEHM